MIKYFTLFEKWFLPVALLLTSIMSVFAIISYAMSTGDQEIKFGMFFLITCVIENDIQNRLKSIEAEKLN